MPDAAHPATRRGRRRRGAGEGMLFPRVMRTAACTLFFLAALVIACGSPQAPPAGLQKASPAVGAEASPSPSVKHPDTGFASRQKLADHYRKHGREFGTITMEEYLRKAQELRDRPADKAVLESVRSDGVVTRYDRNTGDFIAFDGHGVIRTFFRPADGEAYFRRQAKKSH